MKRLSVFALLTALGLVACSGHDPVSSAGTASPAPATPAAAAAPTAARARDAEPADLPSVYDLRVAVTDQDGVVRSVDAYRGHPVLITMFYAGCRAACPLLTSDLKAIERKLSDKARSDVRILMVSFDAAHDTPKVLSQLMQERAMDRARWTLGSANEDDARSLAGVLGIRYRKLDAGDYFHTSSIVLLDGQGRPRARLDGLGKDSTALVQELEALD